MIVKKRPLLFVRERQRILYEDWLKNLKNGDLVDALDDSNEWHEAVIETICSREGIIKLTFPSWSKRYDICIRIIGDRCRVLPRHFMTEDWRKNLDSGQEIEIRSNGTGKWFRGRVLFIRRRFGFIKLLIRNETTSDETIVILKNDASRNPIVPLGTHIDPVKRTYPSDPLSIVSFESDEKLILTYWRMKYDVLDELNPPSQNKRQKSTSSIIKDRFPHVSGINVNLKSTREMTIHYTICEMKEDVFRKLMDML